MSSRTLAQLRADALVEADLRAGQISTGEVNRIVNDELSALWELVLEQHQDRFILTDATLTIAAGSDSVSLPGLFWRSPRLTDITDANSDNHRVLPTFEYDQRFLVREKSFCIFNNSILVRPSSEAPGSYQMDCQYEWSDLLTDAATISFPNDWHRWSTMRAGLRLREIQQMPTTSLERQIADIERRIVAAGRKRKGKRKIADVRSRRMFAGRVRYPSEEW